MSAGEQPSSPDRGRRATSDDQEAAPDNQVTVTVPSLFPSEHLRQIYAMASPPYAYPRDLIDAEGNIDEEMLFQIQNFHSLVVVGGANSSHPMGDAWRMLDEYVDRLATTNLRPWDTLSLTTRESLRGLFGESAKPYYDSRHAYLALVKAWLWHALDDNLFSDPDKWATPQWKAYGTLCASFRRRRAGTLDSAVTLEEHRESGVFAENEFHYWRMLTMRIMTEERLGGWTTNAPPHTSVDRLVDRLMGKLAEIIDESDRPLSTYEDDARRTARFAVSTDLQILRSSPNIMIAWRLPNVASATAMKGRPFRKSDALRDYDDVFEKECGDQIDFVVSPGVFQSGQPSTRFDEGSWQYPIRVAISGALVDPWAEFRSVGMMNQTGSWVANT
jgi:hypothetical protein